MEGNFKTISINTIDVDPFELERENSSSDNSRGSPSSTARASVSSSKTRRGIEKRVLRIPIKGDCNTNTTPPSDSWAWRKYGQKPIKGSPYPRGYYKCSSSKGCPARKQVERSRSDPTLLLITYSYDHNHSFPVSRNQHGSKLSMPTTNIDTPSHIEFQLTDDQLLRNIPINKKDNNNNSSSSNNYNNNSMAVDEKFSNLESSREHIEELLMTPTDDYDWTFPHMETTSSAILDHPIFSDSTTSAATEGNDFPSRYFRPPLMAAEEESLFDDLGELPECSVVFGSRFPTPAPWCGSTG